MNTFNRVLLVILFLVAIPLCTLVLVIPVPVLETIGAKAQAMADGLSTVSLALRLALGVLLALVVDFILIVLVVLELRRPKAKAIEVEQLTGGQVLVNVNSIADRLQYEVDMLPGVLHTKPKVASKKGGVIVELDVEAAAGINVSESAVPIVELVQDVIENKLGLRMARPPKVQLHTVGYPKAHKVPAAQRAEVRGIRGEVKPGVAVPSVDVVSSEEPVGQEALAEEAREEDSQTEETDQGSGCAEE